MEHVEEDWNMLKDKKEVKIIEKYTYIGNLCTLCFTSKSVHTYMIIVARNRSQGFLYIIFSSRFHSYSNLFLFAIYTEHP